MPPENKPDFVRVGSLVMTILLAIIAFTTQWGAVNTKLDALDKRICDMLSEFRALKSDMINVERRIAFIEGTQGATKK